MPFTDLARIIDRLSKVELAARLVAVDIKLGRIDKHLRDIGEDHIDCLDCERHLAAAKEIVEDARTAARGRVV